MNVQWTCATLLALAAPPALAAGTDGGTTEAGVAQGALGPDAGASSDQPMAGASPAQGQSSEPLPGFAANQIVGHVDAMDPAKNTITITRPGRNGVYRLTAATTVFVDGRLGELQDLKPGQDVRAAFENREGELTVRWIEVAPPGTFLNTGAAQRTSSKDVPARQVEGKVTSVGASQAQVLDSSGRSTTIRLNDSTQVLQGGQPRSIADLKQGADVRATLDNTGSSATRIDILQDARTSTAQQSADPR